MIFRPCIDIHNGKVKQIVGSSLRDSQDESTDNFISELDGTYYSDLYYTLGLKGGHVIILNPAGSKYYDESLRQAKLALCAHPGMLQIGGGINPDNAKAFLDAGASHVIVTSYVFKDGRIDRDKLEILKKGTIHNEQSDCHHRDGKRRRHQGRALSRDRSEHRQQLHQPREEGLL